MRPRLSHPRSWAAVLAVAILAMVTPFGSAHAAADDEVPTVVVLQLVAGADIGSVVADNDEAIESFALVPQENVHAVVTEWTTEVRDGHDPKVDKKAEDWVKKDLDKDPLVEWALIESPHVVDDDRLHAWRLHAWRLHAWTDGASRPAAPSEIENQAAMASIGLDGAQQRALGAGVRVAVLDTGVDPTHPLLASRLAPGIDLVDLDDDPTDVANGIDDDGDGQVDEAYGHGTFVAGVIAQVAPEAEIVPIRVLDADGYADQWAVLLAVRTAIALDVDVINMSFGIDEKAAADALKDAIDAAEAAGIAVVAAAGNAADSHKRFPASEKQVLSVGAVADDIEHLAPFSNHGKWVQLAAPGVDIVSSVPGGGYAAWQGTSVSTPLVTGVVALAFENAPENAAAEISKAVLQAAKKMKKKGDVEDGFIDAAGALDRLGWVADSDGEGHDGVLPRRPKGDVNCDNVVTILDALLIAQFTTGTRTAGVCPGLDPASELALESGDVDGNDVVDMVDALLIANCVSGRSTDRCTNN